MAPSPRGTVESGGAAGGARASDLEDGSRLAPVPLLSEELHALIDQELAVVRQGDLDAFQGAGRRTFEVDPGALEPAPVARALELVLLLEPVGGAAQVGADGEDGVEPIRLPHDPDPLVPLPALADRAHPILL